MILVENWEEYRRHWSSKENRVDDHGDDKEGGTSAMGASDGLWHRWPATIVVEDIPFCFFDDSAIWWSFNEFQSVESKKEWKWWSFGFVGRDLVKKWRRYEDLKFGRKRGATIVSFVAATFETHVIYSGGWMVIDYRTS